MSRRKLVVLAQIAALVSIALYLFVYVGFRSATGPLTKVQPLDPLDISPDAILPRQNLTAYVLAILDPTTDTDLATFKCPSLDLNRYKYLQQQDYSASSQPPIRYFFALNLRNCLPLLPRLLGSVLEAIRFLGPASCALSIVEGNSPDGTAEVLAALEPQLSKLGIRTYFTLNMVLDPLGEGSDRFTSLASLRNMALAPLRTTTTPADYTDDATTVLFINDVAICPDDILELAHQRRHQAADMACAMDWTGDPPAAAIFYDSYIARAIHGDLFFEIPAGPSWARATDLFWNEPVSRARFARHEPFQVFSCWNGAVVFTARPVVEGQVAFRASRKDRGECHAGEPELFCKDMWLEGYGRIMVVPGVNLEYTVETGERIKAVKGFASSWVAESDAGTKIEWLPAPDQVKCMPTFDNQSWRPWNDTLA
ncbi:glycosyltransferase [Chaetomidium leptoderma]|uniref:Glycosyltransferase n=1 Tax=Chaetomidium leptoderma TaxID=669021 RepID=A0AAN6VVF9_9PEZI|nr:glycosyltransferase [Chaetomidium leptoderma]